MCQGSNVIFSSAIIHADIDIQSKYYVDELR